MSLIPRTTNLLPLSSFTVAHHLDSRLSTLDQYPHPKLVDCSLHHVAARYMSDTTYSTSLLYIIDHILFKI